MNHKTLFESTGKASQSTLPLPRKFDANSSSQADLWPKWLRRLERYSVVAR
jgi:hypothetical protein